MTRDKTRRVLVTVVAALLLVVGGAVAASGQIGALRGQATSASPSDGPETDSATDDATDDATEGETTEGETTEDETADESTDDETTDESTEDETTEDDESGDEQSEDGESDARGPKAPCTLTSPPNRAASGTDADRHPGWSRGNHFGWCVAAAHHGTTGRPAKPGKVGGEKHVDKPGRPGVKSPKKPHPGKGHGKRH